MDLSANALFTLYLLTILEAAWSMYKPFPLKMGCIYVTDYVIVLNKQSITNLFLNNHKQNIMLPNLWDLGFIYCPYGGVVLDISYFHLQRQ